MRWSGDVTPGDWIAARVKGRGVVGGIVPRGFDAYARVFHPVSAHRHSGEPMRYEERLIRWADVAAVRETLWHPLAQWGGIAGKQYGRVDLDDGWEAEAPDVGRLDLATLAALAPMLAGHTTAPTEAIVGIWSGWGELNGGGAVLFSSEASDEDAVRAAQEGFRAEMAASVSPGIARSIKDGPRFELPGREYVLLTADVREFATTTWVETAGIGWRSGFTGPTPNLLWPADRAWFFATEIDFDSTLIGGSRELVDDILSNPRLEAAEVTEDTDLSSTGDPLNPSFG